MRAPRNVQKSKKHYYKGDLKQWGTTLCRNAHARFALRLGRTNTPYAVAVAEMLFFVIITRHIWRATAAKTDIESGK